MIKGKVGDELASFKTLTQGILRDLIDPRFRRISPNKGKVWGKRAGGSSKQVFKGNSKTCIVSLSLDFEL